MKKSYMALNLNVLQNGPEIPICPAGRCFVAGISSPSRNGMFGGERINLRHLGKVVKVHLHLLLPWLRTSNAYISDCH
jgi:hypothetical protein